MCVCVFMSLCACVCLHEEGLQEHYAEGLQEHYAEGNSEGIKISIFEDIHFTRR